MRELLVDYAPYHRSSVKPQSYEEFCAMYPEGKLAGIWRICQSDAKTGEVQKELWTPKIVTDNGAVNILGSAIANASNASPWNDILITNNDGSTTLTTALTNGQTGVTSLSVAAIPAAIPSGTTVQLGFGTGQIQNVVLSSPASQGATSLTVTSFTANAAYAIGSAVVPQPTITDNPTNGNLTANATSPLSQYSGVITGGGFTYANTTGAGNRSVVVSFVFKNSTNGGSTTNGNYTSCWLVNVASGAANTTTGIFVGNYIDHAVNQPMTVSNVSNLTAQITIRI